MDRRTFIGGLAIATLAVPLAAPAQPARKLYRIGILGLPETSDLVGPQPRSAFHTGLQRGLNELGYVYGEHFVTEPRGAAGKPERFPGLAAEMVSLQVDVIVAAGPALPALKHATSTIPITTRSIPVIAVTASAMTHDRNQIMASGFDGYQAKPIGVRSFLQAVREMLFSRCQQ